MESVGAVGGPTGAMIVSWTMLPANTVFERSIARQIELNRSRTPSERFEALCDLLDAVRAMAPDDPEARARRRRALLARQHEREQWRAEFRRHLARQRPGA